MEKSQTRLFRARWARRLRRPLYDGSIRHWRTLSGNSSTAGTAPDGRCGKHCQSTNHGYNITALLAIASFRAAPLLASTAAAALHFPQLKVSASSSYAACFSLLRAALLEYFAGYKRRYKDDQNPGRHVVCLTAACLVQQQLPDILKSLSFNSVLRLQLWPVIKPHPCS